MRDLASEIVAQLAARQGVRPRYLIWFVARNRDNPETAETMGLWTGGDHREFVIGAETRTYYGAGGVLDVPEMVAETGLTVRMQTVALSAIAPEVALLIRGYEPRFARVEIHRAFFSTETNNLLAAPERVFKGVLDEVTVHMPEAGGEARVEAVLAPATRALTRVLGLKKSHQSQRLRDGGDDFFINIGTTGTGIRTPWGEKMVDDPRTAKPAPPLSDGHNWRGDGP